MKQIILDTNIILRLIIGDVIKQLKEAKIIFKDIENEKITGLISILVLNELIWILESFYNKPREEYIPVILKLFSLKGIKFMEVKKRDILVILSQMEKVNLDFTDMYLHWQSKQLSLPVVTFDKQLQKTPLF